MTGSIRFAEKVTSITHQPPDGSANDQFGKTQFFLDTLYKYNFGPFSTKLGGTVWAIKKMTQNDYGPGPGRNYGETAVFTFGRKACAQARKQHLDTAIPTDAVSSSNYLEKVF